MSRFTSNHARKALLSVLVTASLVTLLSACTPNSDAGPTKSPSPTTAGLPPGVTGVSVLPTNVPNVPTTRAQTAISSCAAVKGGWAAGGIMANPTAEKASYTITVYFTTSSATVIGTAQTTVEVGGNSKADWTASDQFIPAPETKCVLVGVG